MIFPSRRTRALSIACPNFEPAEVNALQSLLGLLKPHLRQPWQIAGSGDIELMLINLDAPYPATSAALRIGSTVGCALRPSAHASGTLHRPLRVAQVLALLNELENGVVAADEDAGSECHYQLRCWPADAEHWPWGWTQVLASIAHARRSLTEIVARTGQPADEVGRCITALERLDLLCVEMAPVSISVIDAARVRGWRSLAAKMGSILGWSR